MYLTSPHKDLRTSHERVLTQHRLTVMCTCTFLGSHKAHALAKCIEEGINHMFTVSAIQMHPKAIVVCDEDATLELRVRMPSALCLPSSRTPRFEPSA